MATATEVDPALRHLPKLSDTPNDCEPVYECRLCRRRGTLDQLRSDECPARSGAMRRIGGAAAGAPPGGSSRD